mmetsp:Transcript_17561/g.42225  ORF Transcript_17561/g.42225 Transcript_17561/m.42225 type:complete len:205 (+) Transcript_17561:45-659(+)
MPSLQKVETSPNNCAARGTACGETGTNGELFGEVKVTAAGQKPAIPKRKSFEAVGVARRNKKRKKSSLEQLGDDDVEDKENSKQAASNVNTTKGMVTAKRTIRDFYSLSPKQDAVASPAAGTKYITPKKRKTAKFVALNEDAKPIHIHIPFVGQEKYSAVTIEAHCIESRFDLGDEPLMLAGKYHPRSKIQIERFLDGFGRFIH